MQFTINNFAEFNKRQAKKKDGTIGATRYTSTIRADAITTRFDAKALGRAPAQAIAKHLRDRVANISTQASPATVKIRERDAKQLAGARGSDQYGPVKQSEYLRRRYAKGSPSDSRKLFNDSGRFAKGITVGAAIGNRWIVNVPANRWNPDLLRGGAEALQKMLSRLVELIPEFGSAAAMRDVLSVRRAIKEATGLIDPRLIKGAKKTISKFLNQKVDLGNIVDGFNDVIGLTG